MPGIGPFWRQSRTNNQLNHHAWASLSDKMSVCKLFEYDKAEWQMIVTMDSPLWKRCSRCTKVLKQREAKQPKQDIEEDFL